MAKSVSFYTPTDKSIDRKRKMAEMLMQQGQQPQNTEMVSGVAVKQSPLAGIAKALTSGLGGLTEGAADRAEQQKVEGSRKTMADALEAYSRSQAGGETTTPAGETISWNKAPLDRAGAMYQNILMGNPDTAPLAMQQAMENIQYDQRFPKELELARAKAAIEAQYRTPAQAAAAIQIADAMGQARASGDTQRLKDLQLTQKVFEKGMYEDEGGTTTALPGYAGVKTDLSYADQSGQNMSDAQYKPAIAKDTAIQSEIGKRQGEAAGTLGFLEANMPKLEQMTNELSTLGKTATYTKAGQARNVVTRELGGQVPQGGIDRAAYIAKVDNEVLPLLRDTFGAAFTVVEGEKLRATLGGDNLSPPEKDAVLRAFIAQKKSQVEALKRQVGPQGQGSNPAITQPDYSQIQPAITTAATVPPLEQDQDGDTATGPNGEKLIFRGGRWVPK